MKPPTTQSELYRDETGSISILIIGLFLLTLVLSFTIIDISGNFAVKRQLIHDGEVAITRAAHNLDSNRYYSGERYIGSYGDAGPIYRVPVDCDAANSSFINELGYLLIKGKPLRLLSWGCESDLLTAKIATHVPLLLDIPFLAAMGFGNSEQEITATIKASSTIG